jgi:hypothetical protein
MARLIIILILCPIVCFGQSPSFAVNDLLSLSAQSPKNFDNYLNKKGFLAGNRSVEDDIATTSFFEKIDPKDTLPIHRSVDLYKKNDAYYFCLHTSCPKEYKAGMNELKRAGFFYDNSKDVAEATSLMFQKGPITVRATPEKKGDDTTYTFILEKKEFPDPGTIRYAEDLLSFDSHEHLIAYFGKRNVKEDVYRMSPTETRKCSVLFPNTSRQAVFIWDDEANLYKISFILISGVLPTVSAVQFNRSVSQNTWTLRDGIYSGMRIQELLEANGNDFAFYGRNSEYPYMIEPQKTRNIDFKKVGIMLECFNCNGSPLLNRTKVSASDAVDNGLAMYVSFIMISP